GHWWQYW
ncbi:SAM-dependent methyltransferase domain protein, partial [Vibrio harveyi]